MQSIFFVYFGMGHDQLFKEVFQAHLQAFLELFFPDVAVRLDFDSLRFLDKEVFTDSPEGSRREADVVAALETHEGAKELVLVHIEVQVRPRKEFAERMFEYYVLLRRRHQVPVFPIVVYLRGGQGVSEEEYQEPLFGREQLRFRYMSIGLAKLDSSEYVEKSPLAAALAALMSRAGVPDRLKLRAEMLRQIAESRLDEAQKFLLGNVIETYFELDVEETERFRQFLSTKGYREVEKMEVTWADKMVEKGKREALLRQLATKFGSVSEETRSRIQALESAAELDKYLERVLTAESIDAMGL